MEGLWNQLVAILVDASAYLLLGFALSGVLFVLLERHQRLMEPMLGLGARPVVMATLLGMPLPLCSCSVLPTGMTLLRRGASKGAAASFLITVPETDVVSILVTYGLLGPVLAVFRPLAALVTGIVTGLAVNVSQRRDLLTGAPDADDDDLPLAPRGPSCVQPAPAAGAGWLRRALHFGFVELLDHLIVRLLVGLAAGAAIAAVLPALDVGAVTASRPATYLLMLVLGVPMYVCATSSTPIAAGLIAAGVSPGAALVFLLTGPATNTANIAVLDRQFGRPVLFLYLACIAVVSVGMGLVLDALAPLLPAVTPAGYAATAAGPPPWALLSAAAFLALAAGSLWRTRTATRLAGWIERRTGRRPRRRTVIATLVLLLAALWVAQGIFTVAPGERAAVTFCGRVAQAPRGPGLHLRWPSPLGAHHAVSVAAVRRADIGYRVDFGDTTTVPAMVAVSDWSTDSWMLTGDENIIDIRATVHYRVRDDREAVMRVLFGIADLAELVEAAGEWALRRFVAGNAIDSLLTSERGRMEEVVARDFLQPALDLCDAGVRVVSVSLTSVHAPQPVHPAFRDVASAAEDAVQKINQAREYAERTVREAHGARNLQVAEAAGKAVGRIAQAAGDSTAFALASAVYARWPALMRTRLYLETLDATLPDLRKYVDLTPAGAVRPEVWLRLGATADLPSFLQDLTPPPEREDR